jgi:hypothetical protein
MNELASTATGRPLERQSRPRRHGEYRVHLSLAGGVTDLTATGFNDSCPFPDGPGGLTDLSIAA